MTYSDLHIQRTTHESKNAMTAKALFITGRFRSGTTLLWNIFRNIESCCAYYEPCHDLLLSHIRHHSPLTVGHIGVQSYWDEYLPILDKLKEFHRIEFGVTRLLLEENSPFEELAGYIRFLNTSIDNRLPVLQFNRMDFRLPWLKQQFPQAKIIHLFRNPRDQWFSMVRELPQDCWSNPLLNTDYELMTWSCALGFVFPFLFSSQIKTSYHRHYLLWKLSKQMGVRLSDISIDFDREVLARPAETIDRILATAEIEDADIASLKALIASPKTGAYKTYRERSWFESAEIECDAILEDLGLDRNFGRIPVTEIVKMHPDAWNRFEGKEIQKALEETLKLFATKRKEDFEVRNELKVSTEHFRERMKIINRFKFLKYLLPRDSK